MIQTKSGSDAHYRGHADHAFDSNIHGAKETLRGVDREFAPPGQVIHLGAREPIFFEGDSADYFYRTEHGSVFAQQIFIDGARQISGLFPTGTYFGLTNLEAPIAS